MERKGKTKMKKITALLVVAILVTSLMGNQMIANAEESGKTAYELCQSVSTWEEYKEIFEDFQCERDDFLGHVLKELPEKIDGLSTFMAFGYGGIKDEEIDAFEESIRYATSLYSNSETAHLRFSVEKKDLEGPYSRVDVFTEDNKLTHIGNVVKCYDIPYYSCVDNYLCGKNACYYKKQIICYTCGVAYWNPDGTLEKMEYIPFDEVAKLKDEQKPQIDRDFDGTILILLCTTDTLLGWTSLDGLFQYEDAMGNMEFYNPYFIRYE